MRTHTRSVVPTRVYIDVHERLGTFIWVQREGNGSETFVVVRSWAGCGVQGVGNGCRVQRAEITTNLRPRPGRKRSFCNLHRLKRQLVQPSNSVRHPLFSAVPPPPLRFIMSPFSPYSATARGTLPLSLSPLHNHSRISED